MCALLVARRVGGVETIVVTRLPVGHTHEDIDAKFGIITLMDKDGKPLKYM
jgi:hypothetical protein